MAISGKIKEQIEQSNWVRLMFETGNALKAEHGADNVFDFSIGNPNVPPPPQFDKVLTELAADNTPGVHAYMTQPGYLETRAAIAEYVGKQQGVDLGPQHIIMSVGAAGGLNVVLKAIADPGDEVVVPVPFFMEYKRYIDNHGAEIVTVPSQPDFDLDIEAIRNAINRKTAAVLINSPNNPSGKVYSEQQIQDLGRMLDEESGKTGREIYLINDEPYRMITFDGVEVPPIMQAYRNSIIVTSSSKDLSLPGERIGYIAINSRADDVQELIDGAITATRTLGYINAPALMQRVLARIQGIHVDAGIYQKKRDLLCAPLREMGYDFVTPQGTFYLMPKAPGGDDLGFIRTLQEELILAVPSKGFGIDGYFRLAFCVDDKVITNSMPGFERALKKATGK